MNKAGKTAVIEELKDKLSTVDFFYLADSSTLTVEQVNNLRRLFFEKGVEMRVVKNTLVRKAMEAADPSRGYDKLYDSLKGPTALLFTDTANVPAKVIKEFRKSSEKPVLKAAYIDSSVYVGDDQLDALASLKSKEEMLAEVIMLLQSPVKNVLGSLQSGGQTISGLLKALEERAA